MDITNMLNGKGPSAVTAANGQQFSTGYPSLTDRRQSMSVLTNDFEGRPFEDFYLPKHQQDEHQQKTALTLDTNLAQSTGGNGTVRTFPCTTCGKRFARRSDLARHERIHSGDRPHVCPEKGCGKPFIQRSALTVHMRVHSGEKPHMCERCGKPFSDSSSLARHRRIHSGKRPYKCPFADCQKTFTRRTTLTRHQNHHSGTVEEAAAATARILASRGPGPYHHTDSDSPGIYSDTASVHSATTGTLSPSESNFSISPTGEVPSMPYLNRQSSNLSYNSSDSLPPHMRSSFQQSSPRSSPSSSSPSLSAFGGSASYHRPSLTSHPNLPVLEPPTYHDLRSSSGSPHLSSTSTGWQSPVHPSNASPVHGDFSMHPDSPYGGGGGGGVGNISLYHPSSNMRRPQSTEPDHYELRPRMAGGGVWS